MIGVIGLVALPLLWHLGKDLTYALSMSEATAGTVEYVEYQPNSDWPKRQVTDAETIAKLRAWLLATGPG